MSRLSSMSSRISTLAPREGSDDAWLEAELTCTTFQPSLPARGATSRLAVRAGDLPISTLAPREGSDGTSAGGTSSSSKDFNPRSPRGERRIPDIKLITNWTFQPSLPARGATLKRQMQLKRIVFQPSLPARGATRFSQPPFCINIFQPSLPARGATAPSLPCSLFRYISTLAPREGSDKNYRRIENK